MNIFMYTSRFGVYMARPYWRVKKDGKWTWTPAKVEMFGNYMVLRPLAEVKPMPDRTGEEE